jgi:hypothetical protein
MSVSLTALDDAWGSAFQPGRASTPKASRYHNQERVAGHVNEHHNPGAPHIAPVHVAVNNQGTDSLLPDPEQLDAEAGFPRPSTYPAQARSVQGNHHLLNTHGLNGINSTYADQVPRPLDETLRLLLVQQLIDRQQQQEQQYQPQQKQRPLYLRQNRGSHSSNGSHPLNNENEAYNFGEGYPSWSKEQYLIVIWSLVAVTILLGLVVVGLGAGLSALRCKKNCLEQAGDQLRKENEDLKIQLALQSASSVPNTPGTTTPLYPYDMGSSASWSSGASSWNDLLATEN